MAIGYIPGFSQAAAVVAGNEPPPTGRLYVKISKTLTFNGTNYLFTDTGLTTTTFNYAVANLGMSQVTGMFVDNSSNIYALVFYVGSTGQAIKIPPLSQKWVKIFSVASTETISVGVTHNNSFTLLAASAWPVIPINFFLLNYTPDEELAEELIFFNIALNAAGGNPFSYSPINQNSVSFASATEKFLIGANHTRSALNIVMDNGGANSSVIFLYYGNQLNEDPVASGSMPFWGTNLAAGAITTLNLRSEPTAPLPQGQVYGQVGGTAVNVTIYVVEEGY